MINEVSIRGKRAVLNSTIIQAVDMFAYYIFKLNRKLIYMPSGGTAMYYVQKCCKEYLTSLTRSKISFYLF